MRRGIDELVRFPHRNSGPTYATPPPANEALNQKSIQLDDPSKGNASYNSLTHIGTGLYSDVIPNQDLPIHKKPVPNILGRVFAYTYI